MDENRLTEPAAGNARDVFIVRAFDATGRQWLQREIRSETEKDAFVRHLKELSPESKLSIVDLRAGKLEEITPTTAG
jgi:hypothetical protein